MGFGTRLRLATSVLLRGATIPSDHPLITHVPAAAVGNPGFWGSIRESFAGAWQRNMEVNPTEGILAFSAVFASIGLIAGDISKLRPRLVRLESGIWRESTSNAAICALLLQPNHYQTPGQVLSAWMVSKLIFGNTYILKERDSHGNVVALHVLNPRMCKAAVADNSEVFYQLSSDNLTGAKSAIVPASEIIHDRGECLFHPLVGVPPIFACGMSSTQGQRIQNNSGKFFENMSRPSGLLAAEGEIADSDIERIKTEFERNFSGSNIGRLLVMGSGMTYTPMTIPAAQAQLIEQLKWTVEDVARCFGVPLHKIASETGVKFSNMAAMNQDYYNQTLQKHIEGIEALLDRGLGLTAGGTQTLGVELDLDGLLRMDLGQQAEIIQKLIASGAMSPNEGRAKLGLPPVEGGETPYLQQQNFPLFALARQVPENKSVESDAQLRELLEAVVGGMQSIDRRIAARDAQQGVKQ